MNKIQDDALAADLQSFENEKKFIEEIETVITDDNELDEEGKDQKNTLFKNNNNDDHHLEEGEYLRYKDLLGQAIRIKVRNEYATLYFDSLASQSNVSVLIVYRLVSILCTIDIGSVIDASVDFTQLTVHFLTKSYAFSRIPSGPTKREGKATERDILVSRLIDRTIRPLIDSNFQKSIQLICTLLSHHTSVTATDIDLEFLSVLASIAAIRLSSVPLISTPFGCRIAMKGEEFIFCPYIKELQKSPLDLFLSFANDEVIMIECEAKNLDKSVIVNAVSFAKQKKAEIENVLTALEPFKREKFSVTIENKKIQRIIRVKYGSKIELLLEIPDKVQRNNKFDELEREISMSLIGDDFDITIEDISKALFTVKKSMMHSKVFETSKRIDGRKIDEIRAISARMNVPFMPSSHGSSMFCRGKTNALVSVILGTAYDEQAIEGFESEKKERFILHYTFPPYATGDVSQIKTPNRREIGHAKLAFKALRNFIPEKNVFPYTIRVASEILSCDGSSSMATICAATLAMIDAGVPLESCVAGIALGVVVNKEKDEILLLSDLIGDEDHLGDMDFKVAGTVSGITALQLDVKEFGIKSDKVLDDILTRGMSGIKQIIDIMSQEIEFKKTVVKKNAPLIYQMSVDKNQSKMIIGNRGDTIKTLCEVSGARIDVDSGTGIVSIFANNKEIIDRAVQMIKDLILQAEVGKVYDDGIVEKITDFGIFVRFLSDKMLGLLHEKNCDNDRYAFLNLKRSVRIGCKIKVRVIFISADGKIGLSPVFEDKQENDNSEINKAAVAIPTSQVGQNDLQNNSQESRGSNRTIRPIRDAKIENYMRAENSIKESEVFAEEISRTDNIKTEIAVEKKEIRKEEPIKDFKNDPKYNCNFF